MICKLLAMSAYFFSNRCLPLILNRRLSRVTFVWFFIFECQQRIKCDAQNFEVVIRWCGHLAHVWVYKCGRVDTSLRNPLFRLPLFDFMLQNSTYVCPPFHLFVVVLIVDFRFIYRTFSIYLSYSNGRVEHIVECFGKVQRDDYCSMFWPFMV